jgi:hypothetical protein
MIYDSVLWKPTIRRAFPNVGDLDRRKVESLASQVKMIRNRIAHHENVLWGIPLGGQRDSAGNLRRLTLAESHDAITELAQAIDADLAAWLKLNSAFEDSIKSSPVADTRPFLL